jgi:hypothetical protein
MEMITKLLLFFPREKLVKGHRFATGGGLAAMFGASSQIEPDVRRFFRVIRIISTPQSLPSHQHGIHKQDHDSEPRSSSNHAASKSNPHSDSKSGKVRLYPERFAETCTTS